MGVIPKRLRDAFLNRERSDYRTYKQLTLDDLDREMKKLPAQPPIWYKLDWVQRVCFIIGAKNRRFAFLNDTGTGKSLLAIALVRFFRLIGVVQHVLILVPRRPNKWEWESELQKHSPKSSYLILDGSSLEKRAALRDSKALFVIETYGGFIRLLCVKEKRKNKKGMRLVPDKKLIGEITAHFQGLICDESHNVKNHTKLPYRLCRQMSKTAKVVLALTGTPFNRDPSELWAQFYLVDHGQTLGETLGLFRSVFFKETLNWFGFPEYKFDKTKENGLNKMLANRSISFEAEGLPPVVYLPKYVTLPQDAEAYYQKTKDALVAAHGNFTEIKNAFLRMRQISSGFIGYHDDETGEKAKFEFPENPKLDGMLSMIESVRTDHKIIVFFDFVYSGERIADALSDMKLSPLLIHGKTKNVDKMRSQFINNPKKQILCLQHMFGEGLNLQVAKYGMFYEIPVSAIRRKQCWRRVERQHSLHDTVFMADFIVKGTADEAILKFHTENRDLMQALIRQEVQL